MRSDSDVSHNFFFGGGGNRPMGSANYMDTCYNLKLIYTATPDATKLSCLCRVRFRGLNWIHDNSRVSSTENLKSEHTLAVLSNSHRHARYDSDRTVLSCLVWRCELSRPDSQTRAF